MPYMKPIDGFEPGRTTKERLLLFVHKDEKHIGKSTLPGLFQDSHYVIMLGFFFVALVLEFLGLQAIIDAFGQGFDQSLVAFAILADLFLAFLLSFEDAANMPI